MKKIGNVLVYVGAFVVCLGMSLAGCQKLVIIQSGGDVDIDEKKQVSDLLDMQQDREHDKIRK